MSRNKSLQNVSASLELPFLVGQIIHRRTFLCLRELSFIRAPHSRARLCVTRAMLARLLTYYQVPPAFLNHIFLFGDQRYPRESACGGFGSRLLSESPDYRMLDHSSSGAGLQQHYSLKSVKPCPGSMSWPWSVRQTSLFHWQDFDTGRSSWIIVKASDLIRNRVSGHLRTKYESFDEASLVQRIELCFEIHLILCDWADEQWSWYIDYIDEHLHSRSR